MEENNLKYFLAANSCEGFINKFDNCYNPNENWQAYIIKGGPGTGKSSFMKHISRKATQKDMTCIFCPCSSDPDSLDAVILPEKKTVILDGTAPHTLDPMYPGICEEILNFGEFWDSEMLKNKTAILEITNQNKALHITASRYLQAVGQLMLDNYKTASACTQKLKTLNFAQKLCNRYIKKSDGKPYEWVRFIGGISPKGVISFPQTVENTCKEIIIISDCYGAASNIIIEQVRKTALENGYEIITLKNPFLPSLITDHIIIPELSLAFVTENSYIHFNCDSRRIHARRFTINKLLHQSKERVKFNKKAISHLLNSARDTLFLAKTIHDQLESYYIEAMNFQELNKFAEKFCKKIL